MTLVDYSDSDSDYTDNNDNQKGKTKPRTATTINSLKRRASSPPARPPPPLPPSFHSLYATSVRSGTADDPDLHAGRKRQTPHIQGNWPTHVYLEWIPNRFHLERLEAIIERVKNLLVTSHGPPEPEPDTHPKPGREDAKVHSFLRSPLNAPLALHISLSAPLVLPTETKDAFHQDLTASLLGRTTRSPPPVIRQFTTSPTLLKWVPNHDGSRHFLVLGDLTQPPEDQLNELLRRCNAVAERFGLVQLYDGGGAADDAGGGYGSRDSVGRSGSRADRRRTGGGADGTAFRTSSSRSSAFHVSVAWSLQARSPAVQEELKKIDLMSVFGGSDNVPAGDGESEAQGMHFSEVKIKIGNVVHVVSLAK